MGESTSVIAMFQNLYSTLVPIELLVVVIAYVMGVSFFFIAVYKLKQYGELRTMMSSSTDLKGPIIYMIVAAGLLYLPSMIHVSLASFYADPEILAYTGDKAGEYRDIMKVVVRVVQIVGLIAFIRGWSIIAKLSGQGAQPGSLGKGVTHIIGGILAMNIVATTNIVSSTLGVDPIL